MNGGSVGTLAGKTLGHVAHFKVITRQVVAQGAGIPITSFLALRPKEVGEEEKATVP